jgi:hypothetical protein
MLFLWHLLMQFAVWKLTHHIYTVEDTILISYLHILLVTQSAQVTKTSSLLGLVTSLVSYTQNAHKAIFYNIKAY